ncbi:MAG: hypothetical protein M1559_02215 [Candidatus Marsarchaeota archaeon]|nr:hypothetical protein [Candidatus Marsarchaeota archaeon]
MGIKSILKAQSAMEYLMTYGWAILVIAIVLAALFTLGIFSSPLGTTCKAVSSEFSCGAPIFTGTSGSSGSYLVTLGQGSGITWYLVGYAFIPTGIATPSANALGGSTGQDYPTGSTGCTSPIDWVPAGTPGNTLASGGVTPSLTFCVPSGTTGGTIWGEFTPSPTQSAPSTIVEVAKATMK